MDADETPGFRDRAHGRRLLAQRLRSDYAGRDNAIVLALPRGGVPVAETLDALTSRLERTTGSAKIVVRARNSHLGDARANRPEIERLSHYVHARLADQFDAVIHIDETHALEPLERSSEWEAGDLPETYPWGV